SERAAVPASRPARLGPRGRGANGSARPVARAASGMIPLPQVTLACVDCAYHDLAAEALRRCLSGVRFGRAVLLTDRAMAVAGVETLPIAPLRSVAEYSEFVLKRLVDYVDTPHVLLVQWDGFVLNPGAWREDFLSYDYVGAPWPWHQDGRNVGNGGFSLRS